MDTRISPTVEGVLDTLVRAAVTVGAPPPVAEEARRATQALFKERSVRAGADRVRAESYFWGVVRRRALRGEAPAIARMIVAASIAADRSEAGLPPDAVVRWLT
jgi:hypothetical protein